MTSNNHFHIGIAIVLAMTTALAPLALDTYLPAFPAMASSLGVRVHDISLTIAVYVFVLAFGQLIGGPLSDRFGRRRIMLIGLTLFGVASFLIYRSETLEALLILRAVQAFGGGWATVCVPAIVRDRLSGTEAARFFSLIGLIMILAPAIAPSLGSLILAFWGWNGIFLFLAGYTLLLMGLLQQIVFPSLSPHRAPIQAVTFRQRYAGVSKVKPARRFLLLQALAFAIMLLFISHSSFIYQDYFGAGPTQFALLFGANVLAMMVINLCNRRLLLRFSSVTILRWGLSIQAVGILLLLLISLFLPVWWLFLPAMMMTVGAMGAISPNTQACYMEYFPQHGGTAAALLGACQFFIAGLIVGFSSLLPESVPLVIATQAICSAACLLIVFGSPQTSASIGNR
ncbi:DHA1 family bicyclomycin/chloramphenicol resistance-like MFS transporter [Litorivivens lipolytica]|uniref:Bcr/CflA family efflux transporter n=1 Tax=Litorivivens lipolytica TaxID=1524264 RepID=A0A7W4Z539_9GAMM|nr:DHA1 family bicyclomycin/chloramphenicol resistance-like MFS transporter [Litorivivens lipolytica]